MAAFTIHSDFGAQENKAATFSSSIFHEVMVPDAMTLVFWFWVLSQSFYSLSSIFFDGCVPWGKKPTTMEKRGTIIRGWAAVPATLSVFLFWEWEILVTHLLLLEKTEFKSNVDNFYYWSN